MDRERMHARIEFGLYSVPKTDAVAGYHDGNYIMWDDANDVDRARCGDEGKNSLYP